MLNTTYQQSDESESGSRMSVFKILINMFYSPVEAMKGVASKNRLLVPFIIIFVGTMLCISVSLPAFSQMIKENMEIGIAQNNAPVTQDQINAMANIISYVGIILFPLISVISWMLISLVFFIFVKLFKGEAAFSQIMSIAGMAYVVKLLYYLLSFISGKYTGDLYVNLSLALLVPEKKGQFIYVLLRGIDFFDVWYFSLIGTGIYIVSRLGKKKAILLTLLIFVGYIILGASSMKSM